MQAKFMFTRFNRTFHFKIKVQYTHCIADSCYARLHGCQYVNIVTGDHTRTHVISTITHTEHGYIDAQNHSLLSLGFDMFRMLQVIKKMLRKASQQVNQARKQFLAFEQCGVKSLRPSSPHKATKWAQRSQPGTSLADRRPAGLCTNPARPHLLV